MMYHGYQVCEHDDGHQGRWTELNSEQLPEGEVLIKVHHSSINYKDALSAYGNKGVTKQYPHTPGIDAAGIVVESSVSQWVEGDEAIVFGYDLGMNTAGGFAQYIRVPASWVLRKPSKLSLTAAMAWGTAGFTAALSLMKLERAGLSPDNGPVAVTGACGGVGSVAVSLLARCGYQVTAITGKSDQHDWLLSLGAKEVLERDELLKNAKRPLARALFQGAIDTCGGELLSALLGVIHPEGAVSTCGMVSGTELNASVFPFILRGVSLLGIDSVDLPLKQKQAMLDKIATAWSLPNLDDLVTDITPEQLSEVLKTIMDGAGVGRYRLTIPHG